MIACGFKLIAKGIDMKCEICEREYRQLSQHIRQSHNITAREYRIKFNIPFTKALADDELIERMREIGIEAKSTQKGKANIDNMIKLGKIYNKNRTKDNNPVSNRKKWPAVSRNKVKIGERMRSESESKFEKALTEWMAGVPIKQMCVSSTVIYRWKKEGKIKDRDRFVNNANRNR